MINNDYTSKIFKYLKPFDNICLSELNGNDLLDIIILIDECDLFLRNTLNLCENVTFGLELEFENINNKEKLEQIKLMFPNSAWGEIKKERSLFFGGEIDSPILTDMEENWRDLEKVCAFLDSLAVANKDAGAHVHVGAHVLGNNYEAWFNFFKLWQVYENIIFRFAYGDFLTHRAKIILYAKPISGMILLYEKIYKNKTVDLKDFIRNLTDTRQQAVNFNNINFEEINTLKEMNTIEFRCPNGTLDSIIWQNNVNLFTKLLLYCKNKTFNHDIIDERFRINGNEFNKLELYDEIFLEQALEFCDLIFNNNLDKIYFLKQYLKLFQTYKESNHIKKITLFKKNVI